jgi:hypothetical protein
MVFLNSSKLILFKVESKRSYLGAKVLIFLERNSVLTKFYFKKNKNRKEYEFYSL